MTNFLASATITTPDGHIHNWTASIWTSSREQARHEAGQTLTAILDDHWVVEHYKVRAA